MKPISRQQIKNAFAKADTSLAFCWKVLTDLKNLRSGEDDFAGRFIRFQDVLAATIFNLQHIRDRLLAEEKYIVARKKHYQPNWFTARLRLLAKYKKAIDQVVNMCKAQGDAYAYYFYQNDVELFTGHLGHQRVVNHTAGPGERGELEFLRKVKQIEGYFTLYHGITNILRYGDFSFIDLRKLKVVHIGELKTSQAGPENFNSRLHLISRRDAKQAPGKKIEYQVMEKTRRGRQILGIANLLKNDALQNSPRKSIDAQNYAEQVDRLVKKSKLHEEEFIKVSEGLAYFCLKFRRAGLYHKIFNREFEGMSETARHKLTATTRSLVKQNSHHNEIIISMLLYYRDFSHRTLPGTVPIFWSTISDPVLKDMYLLDCAVFALFNPQHLIGDLREMGIGVESKYAEKTVAGAKPDKTVKDFDLFLPYIVNYLFSESFVKESVKSVIQFALKSRQRLTSINIQQQVNIFDLHLRKKKAKTQ